MTLFCLSAIIKLWFLHNVFRKPSYWRMPQNVNQHGRHLLNSIYLSNILVTTACFHHKKTTTQIAIEVLASHESPFIWLRSSKIPIWFKFYIKSLMWTNFHHKILKILYLIKTFLWDGIPYIDLRCPNSSKTIASYYWKWGLLSLDFYSVSIRTFLW